MPPTSWANAEHQEQRNKLASSYSELLDEFSSKELRTVGNYTVGRLIGKGSFGKVYLATHKLTNGSKVVLKSASKDDANLAREIHHHRQFIHPHIARLYEVIVTESLVWLVLEYCPGDELYHHLLQHGHMEEAKVQRIFTQLVGAVAYVHAKGCVHRDLKLENCLLDKHENVKLVDFGFTREYKGSTSYLQTWCGTVCYSAPEMLKGEKYAGEKVDVWSLGIILYALLCGELPWDEDDDAATKVKILNQEPVYPDYLPAGAKDLIGKLLSKRPLLRPGLADILRHPWLSEHAPLQQEILKLQQPPPFATQLEKDTLQRMRGAGVNIDTVIEHVLAQRCDGLAGWWALLIEKEERKEKRRLRKRKEKDAEVKSIRRLSAASSRLLAASNLREIDEEDHTKSGGLLGAPMKPRGRVASRSNASSLPPDLPMVTEHNTSTPEIIAPPPPMEKDPARSTSSTRRRPAPPPKEYPRRPRAVSRNSSSMLHVVQHNPELLAPPSSTTSKRKRLYQQPFKDQLATIKSWFKDPTKRNRAESGAMRRAYTAQQGTEARLSNGTADLRRTSTGHLLELRKPVTSSPRPDFQSRATYPTRPRISTTSSAGSVQSGGGVGRSHAARPSLSPSPVTPRGSYRRKSGLHGRKSTSSSVSSIRSVQPHQPGHSKASSTSSNTASVASPNLSVASRSQTRSPHTSVKVLPAAPLFGSGTLPSGIRVQRRAAPGPLGSLPTFQDVQQQQQQQAANRLSSPGLLAITTAGGTTAPLSAFSGFGPPSPGLHTVFAKRKRSVFKGPTSAGLHGGSGSNSPRGRFGGGHHASSETKSGGGGEEKGGRRSADLMAVNEGDEDEEDEEGGDVSDPMQMGAPTTSMMAVDDREDYDSSLHHHHHHHLSTVGDEEEEEDEEDIEEVDVFTPTDEGEEGKGGFPFDGFAADSGHDVKFEHDKGMKYTETTDAHHGYGPGHGHGDGDTGLHAGVDHFDRSHLMTKDTAGAETVTTRTMMTGPEIVVNGLSEKET